MALDTTVGGTASDSYSTLVEYKAYADSMGWDYSGKTDEELESCLRRGAIFNDGNNAWKGYKAAQSQARAFPRYGVVDADGYAVASDTIPVAVKNAQMEAAYVFQSGSNPLAVAGNVTKETYKAAGGFESTKEYLGAVTPNDFPAINNLLAGLVSNTSSNIRLARS